jgi:glycosyltransferase involved in cell wall biosynthesis
MIIKIHRLADKFDIIHINSQFISAIVSFLGSRISNTLYKIPKVVTVHHLDYDEFLIERSLSKKKVSFNVNRRISKFIESLVVRKAGIVIAVSDYTKNALLRVYGMSHEKIYVIPNGIALDPGEHLKAPSSREPNNIFILSVARMEPRKGIPILLEAFEALCKKYPNVRLTLVGKGTNKISYLQLPMSVKEKIKTYDYLDDKQLRAIYDWCDIYVSASLLEGFGLTILEAMAAGKPVIAARTSAITEFVEDKVNGLLVDPNNWEALYEAIVYLIKNKSLRQNIGKNNTKYVKSHFRWEISAQRTIDVYRELIRLGSNQDKINEKSEEV